MIQATSDTASSSKYKTIKVDLQRPLYPQEQHIIEELNQAFSSHDLYLTSSHITITLHLRCLDIDKFKQTITSLSKKYQLIKLYKAKENPFDHLIDQVCSIGSYGVKSGKRLYVGYNQERKVKNRKQRQQQRGSFFYANQDIFSTEENPVPQHYVNELICDDSEEVLKKLPDNCIDLVLTSPPYNFGIDYDTMEDGINWEKYFEKLFAVFSECIRVLKYGGRIIVNVQPLFSDYIPSHHIISDFFMKKNLIWKGEILWEKHNYNCKYTAWGSWKSPSSPYLKYTWEFLEVFCKGELKKPGNQDNIDITGNEFKKWVYAKWDIAPEKNMKTYGHEAMFPEKLVERVLKLFSYQDDIILDPFNGVGSTTAVAKKLGRRYLGIDTSEVYTKQAQKRLQAIPSRLDQYTKK